jgi:hypothetical protein
MLMMKKCLSRSRFPTSAKLLNCFLLIFVLDSDLHLSDEPKFVRVSDVFVTPKYIKIKLILLSSYKMLMAKTLIYKSFFFLNFSKLRTRQSGVATPERDKNFSSVTTL